MPASVSISDPTDGVAIATAFLDRFGAAIDRADRTALAPLLAEDAWWRDLLVLSADLRTKRGREAVLDWVVDRLRGAELRIEGFDGRIAPTTVVDDDGYRFVQFGITLRTGRGRGRGVVRLRQQEGDEEWRAWNVLLALQELDGHEERVGPARPRGVLHGEDRGPNWLRAREREQADAGREADVAIVGAGQGGLAVAARLKQQGVRAVVLERNARVGDNWRQRYDSLVLHDPVWYDHLPYLPFPSNWPVFTPKDKLADWMESYAAAMELDVWTGTEIEASDYDDATGRWTLGVRRADGTREQLSPRHVVVATGTNGEASEPALSGRESFAGTVVHSSAYRNGSAFEGQRAVVVGAGNSGHDIAHDLYNHGTQVTMVQRSASYVVSSDQWIDTVYAGLFDESAPPTEDADLLFAAFPFDLLAERHRRATAAMREGDRALLEQLEQRGFKLYFGEDESGLFVMSLRGEGGYYIDVGCSQLIADGKIELAQGAGVEGFTEHGVRLSDGRTLDADVVVLATGFADLRATARRILGPSVDRTGPVWGLDDEGELRGTWRPTGHPGLWFMAGNLQMTRFFSRYLALQLTMALDDAS